MMRLFTSSNTGRDASLWPVFLLLLAVLVPSGGVIWMMRQAMENERLAVRQRLTDVYDSQLHSARQRVLERWKQWQADIDLQAAGKTASAHFAKLVLESKSDSAVVWSPDAELLYPDRLPRSIAANVELQQLEILEARSPQWTETANKLRARLNRYDSQRLSAPQRRFLMRELSERWPDDFQFGTWEAESMAAEFLAASDGQPPKEGVRQAPVEELWSLHSPRSGVTLLYRTSTLKRRVNDFLVDLPLLEGLQLQPFATGETLDSAMQTVTLAPAMPNWKLAIISTDTDAQLTGNNGQRIALFAWTALAVIAATLFLTWLVVQSWRRQMRVAKLKNDLVATVSHELKTPLSSIRLLVDTLLDEDADLHSGSAINGQAREYLELISLENARLTRLIENFLTFSRMERGKSHANLQPIDAREVISQAADAVQERFANEHCELTIEASVPAPVLGDIDLLVTAVVNLLDNAWKYSGDQKRVHLACKQRNGRVVISVQDNGIGLPPGAAEKVFDRFYQVDQHLTRPEGGCGLGLSIVKYLVEAHAGEVAVESQPGKGSTFTISLPLDHEEIRKVASR